MRDEPLCTVVAAQAVRAWASQGALRAGFDAAARHMTRNRDAFDRDAPQNVMPSSAPAASRFAVAEKVTPYEAMKQINHKFCPARQAAQTNPDGRLTRKGQVRGAARLVACDTLRVFDHHWAKGLFAPGSEFPYADSDGAGMLLP